jgi:hypothetical protein
MRMAILGTKPLLLTLGRTHEYGAEVWWWRRGG